MRDIEFRGLTESGEWAYGCLVKCSFKDGDGCGIKDSIYHVNDGYCDLIPERIIAGTGGQYIGQKDKNGAKIYEGDKVCCNGLTSSEVVTIEDIRHLPAQLSWARIYDGSMHVVGNIYEHEDTIPPANQPKSIKCN